jgi:hypothetical protein
VLRERANGGCLITEKLYDAAAGTQQATASGLDPRAAFIQKPIKLRRNEKRPIGASGELTEFGLFFLGIVNRCQFTVWHLTGQATVVDQHVHFGAR